MSSIIDIAEISRIHERLCSSLNIDQNTADRSWNAYKTVCKNYTLDGNIKHWLCCSLFVVCRESITPTVGNAVVEGNCVSLTRLLRSCDISIYDFFQKVIEWAGMISAPDEFRKKVEGLRERFAVSYSVFQKYQPIFENLFKLNNSDECRRSRKSKPMLCTQKKLLEFGWLLFVCVKGEYAKTSNTTVDMVSSYHLLICCVDLLLSNAVYDKRQDLIKDWRSEIYDSPTSDQLCVIAELCDKHDGVTIDAMEVQTYGWIPIIKKLITNSSLKGKLEPLSELITIANFEDNLKSLHQIYESYVLMHGEFDERIFLGSPESNGDSISNSLVTNTPLTSANLNPAVKLTPVQSATQSLARLRHKLMGYAGGVPSTLYELIKTTNLISKLKDRLERMRKIFAEHVSSIIGPDRFQLTEALYFYLLENIIRNEIKIRPKVSITNYIENNAFQTALITCCFEVILFAYNNSAKKFPWVLQCFELDAIDFSKIIEPVVSNGQDIFTRAIVKHLASIEEEIFGSLAWTSSSPLWAKIAKHGKILPSCGDVDMPRSMPNDLSGITPHTPNTKNDIQLSELLTQVSTNGDTETISPNNDNSINSTRCEIINNNNNRQNNDRVTCGSLRLFLRKFYKLAHVRMDLLCRGLELTDQDVLQKIWTIFEHSIVQHSELLKNRHLDQILMCAIYVLNRVAHLNKTFTDIMKFYRTQPQAASHIYRSVFFWIKGSSDDLSNKAEANAATNENANAPAPIRPTLPGNLAGTSVVHQNVERGDIIGFYNQIYVPKIGEYVKQFQNSTVMLSPLPMTRAPVLIPKKILNNCSIYVTQLEKKQSIDSAEGSMTYQFGLSPSKDLDRINQTINREQTNPRKKRIFAETEVVNEPSIKSQRFMSMMCDRQEHSDNE